MYTILSLLKAFFMILGLFVFLAIGILATWTIGLMTMVVLGTILIVPYIAHRSKTLHS